MTGEILQLNYVENGFKLFGSLSSKKSQSGVNYTMPLRKWVCLLFNICINFTKSECDIRILSKHDVNLTPVIINVRFTWVIETSNLLTENINRQPISFQNGILLLPNLIVAPALRPWKKHAFIGTGWNRLKH